MQASSLDSKLQDMQCQLTPAEILGKLHFACRMHGPIDLAHSFKHDQQLQASQPLQVRGNVGLGVQANSLDSKLQDTQRQLTSRQGALKQTEQSLQQVGLLVQKDC